jgi:hypothetical protein
MSDPAMHFTILIWRKITSGYPKQWHNHLFLVLISFGVAGGGFIYFSLYFVYL